MRQSRVIMDNRAAELSSKLVRTYGIRDPFRLCQLLDITVKYISTKRQKGLSALIDDIPFIFINRNMSEEMQRMTCAHELGHILLHREVLSGQKPLLEYELFDIRNAAEYEANAFAANLLIDEEELNDLLQNGADMVTAASSLNINVNLLMIKLLMMRKDGQPIDAPFTPDNAFLGSIKDKADSI